MHQLTKQQTLIILWLVLTCCSAGLGQKKGTALPLRDDHYPFMKEWALAGVEGGIPPQNTLRIKASVTPKDDLQKAVDKLAAKGKGVLLLAGGEYIIRQTLRLPPGVVLRGADRKKVLLSVKMHGYHFKTGQPRQAAILFRHAEGSGIENLTIKYTDAPFEPYDKDSLKASWDKRVFHEKELRDTTLFVEHIWIDSSRNCWVRDCDLLWAGSDPLRITESSHITCSGNYVDRSYNKNDGGMGYYNIIRSSYVLVYNDSIRRIRHFTIQNNSRYNVVINNYLEVDINFHDGDDGYNLIEANTIRIPVWHSWHCFQRGDPKQHRVPGKMNILYNNNAVFKNGAPEASGADKVYLMNTVWGNINTLASDLPLPLHNTFYPVPLINH